MALVGTISGSNGTSRTAVTGTLVIANTRTNFPQIPSDAIVFVSGNLDGSNKTVIGGDLVASGALQSLYSISAEGGELFLTGAQTSTISRGVTIDVYNDKLRIFETGGTNRGGYFDITALPAAVGANLYSGPVFYYVTGAYTASSVDKILGVDTSTTAITITLPTGSVLSAGVDFIIKDQTGNANVNNITIITQGTDTIDLGPSILVNTSLGAKSIYYSGISGRFFNW